jgi:hypothetical protein
MPLGEAVQECQASKYQKSRRELKRLDQRKPETQVPGRQICGKRSDWQYLGGYSGFKLSGSESQPVILVTTPIHFRSDCQVEPQKDEARARSPHRSGEEGP